MSKKLTPDQKSPTIRCRTCGSQHKVEIEDLRLNKGKPFSEISEHLASTHGFDISIKALTNHFNKCLGKVYQGQDEDSLKMMTEIRERKRDLIDILFESLSEISYDKKELEKYLRMNKIHKTTRTMVDLLRVLSQETTAHITLITKLMENKSGESVNVSDTLKKLEEKREDIKKMLKKISKNSFIDNEEEENTKGGEH